MNMARMPVVLCGIIIGVAGFIGYNAIYMPKSQQVEQTRAQIAEERQTQQAQAEFAMLLKEFESYRRRLPSEADPSWLTRKTVELTRTAGIELKNVAQLPPVTLPPFTHYSVSLKFSASYHELGSFLDAVERSDAFFRVERVSAKRLGNGDPEIEVVLGTLFVPPLVSAAQPAPAGG